MKILRSLILSPPPPKLPICVPWIPKNFGLAQNCQSLGRLKTISLLSTISKLTEKAAQQQLLRYLEKHIFNQNSHAYRALHSTTTAMMQLTDIIAEGNDHNLITMLVGIDQTLHLIV